MAHPAHRPARHDEAIDILRRLEPMLGAVQHEMAEVRKEQVEIRKEQVEIRKEQVEIRKEQVEIRKDQVEIRKEQTEIRKEIGGLREANAEIRGQLKYMPTLWQIATAFVSINAATVGLALGLVKTIQSALALP